MIPKLSILNDKHIEHILNEKEISKMYNDYMAASRKSTITEQFLNFDSTQFETKQDEQNLYFFMDFFPGGDLANLFTNCRINMSLTDIKNYLAEIILSLEVLHSNNVVYRDLKLENFVIDKTGHCRLIDFGFSKRLHSERTYTRCGTEGYIAPEIIKNLGHGLPSDIWSLGILFCNMVSGVIPNTKNNLKKVYMLLKKDIYAKDFIEKCLNVDPLSRPTIEEVKRHGYFKDIDWEKIK